MEYKGYTIDCEQLPTNSYYTVTYCGDIVTFKTEEEAKQFIDSIEEV